MALTSFLPTYFCIYPMSFQGFSILNSFSFCAAFIFPRKFCSTKCTGENTENVFHYLLDRMKTKVCKTKNAPTTVLTFHQKTAPLRTRNNIFCIRLKTKILAWLIREDSAQHCHTSCLDLAQATWCHPNWRSWTAAIMGLFISPVVLCARLST